jgi:hypothetical protein
MKQEIRCAYSGKKIGSNKEVVLVDYIKDMFLKMGYDLQCLL